MGPKINGFVVNLETTFCNLPESSVIDPVATLYILVVSLPIRHFVKLSVTSRFFLELKVIFWFKGCALSIFTAGVTTGFLKL